MQKDDQSDGVGAAGWPASCRSQAARAIQDLDPACFAVRTAAITVLAGARILHVSHVVPVTRAAAGFVVGSSFTLWTFGTWLIPLLIVPGLWKYTGRRWPLAYEPALWSVVFPLGMCSVATLSFGRVAHFRFMGPLSRFMLGIAVTAGVIVAAAFLIQLPRRRVSQGS